jgi:hypothetical protein
MRVTTEVLEDVLCALEGRLGVNVPVKFPQPVAESVEGLWVAEGVETLEGIVSVGPAQGCTHLAAEDAAHRFGGEEETGTSWCPCPIMTHTACGHDGMDVRMVAKLLVPRVQDQCCSDHGMQSTPAECEQRCGRAVE